MVQFPQAEYSSHVVESLQFSQRNRDVLMSFAEGLDRTMRRYRVVRTHYETNLMGSQQIGLLGLLDENEHFQRKYRNEVMDDLRRNRATYVVHRDGYIVGALRRRRSSMRHLEEYYLATVKDGVEVDNLEALPDCRTTDAASAMHLFFSGTIKAGTLVRTHRQLTQVAAECVVESEVLTDGLGTLE